MAKGDWIIVTYQVGNEMAKEAVAATQNGRVLSREFEKDGNINWLAVSEVTRGGTIVRKCLFRADAVLSVAEGPFNKERS